MSKGKHYSEAKCPFYKSDSDRCVMCEGINDKTVIKLVFGNNQDFVKYFRTFCGSNQYQRCIINRAVNEKYKNGGGENCK